ncbi:MAG: Gfo/Idh/MocA family oxidoreductase, partial [Planctomycetes bacterium]|nr:Gfo/Idh/MocA family oxidoreductase [Planctomycetota bacterium]
LTSIAAAKAGKDIYCEKPLANSVGEGRAICKAVQQNNRVLQCGSHERSNSNGRHACELVRNGRIGKLHTVRVNLPTEQGHHQQVLRMEEKSEMPATGPVPDGFDYDFWLGHTPVRPYTPMRCHFWWRFILAHGGGEMTDRGAHVIDIGQLGAGKDDTGPVEIEATGWHDTKGLFDAFFKYRFVNTFSDGLKLIGSTEGPRGVKFEGDDGWIMVHIHGCRLEASDPKLLGEKIGDDEIQLGRSQGHHRNFLECVKSRQPTMATAEIGHRTGSICHLNNIAMQLGRKLKWDPVTERVSGDDEANALLTPKMRAPWSLG